MTTASALSESVKSNFLNLSGGTLSGSVVMDDIVALKRLGSDSYMQINGGASWGKGASLELFGKDHTSKGKFLLWAHDGTNYSVLEGFSGGQLTWKDKHVVCVESWTDGTSWYRKYIDGWIEQGGRLSYYTGTITFPVSFSNTVYTFLSMPLGRVSNNYYVTETSSVTTTSITVTWDGEASKPNGVMWYACGY